MEQPSRDPRPDSERAAPPLVPDDTIAGPALDSAETRPGFGQVIPFPQDEDIDESTATERHFYERPVEFHERTRARFALGLLILFGCSTLFALGASVTPMWPAAKDALLIVQPPITLLLGSALAFYFLTVLRDRHD